MPRAMLLAPATVFLPNQIPAFFIFENIERPEPLIFFLVALALLPTLLLTLFTNLDSLEPNLLSLVLPAFTVP